jgi:polyferredoxin
MVKKVILVLLIALSFILLTSSVSTQIAEERFKNDSPTKIVYIEAFQFGFTVKAIQEGSQLKIYPRGSEPSVLEVDRGDRVLFRVVSRDVTHGFYIDDYTPSPSDQKIFVLPGRVLEVGPIPFDKAGKFKLRCSSNCGPLHPFMVMDIVVKPNTPYHILITTTLALSIVMLLYLRRDPEDKMLGIPLNKEIDLLAVKGGSVLKKLVQWRGIQFALILPNLFFFMVILTAGFFGNPVGNRNFSIAVVWILWFAVVEFMILFAARSWCTMCPIPVFGEWIARRRIIGVNSIKGLPPGKKWPKSLNNMWAPALGFLGLSLIIPWLVTRPVVTAIVFLSLILLGSVLYLIYPRRYFCKHVCPASGYIGFHSNASIFAIRSKSVQLCDKHVTKECVRGNQKGYGCPWMIHPGRNRENTYCGQCLECLKSCSLDNMTLKLRMIGKDLVQIAVKARNKFDEAWMGFIRFTLAIFYELVFFGPYFWIRDWGNMGVRYGANLETIGLLTPPPWGIANWFKWALIVSIISLLIYPAVFYTFSWLSKKFAGEVKAGEVKYPAKQIFLSFSYALAPYGLFVWLAFAVSLLAVFWAYPLTAFSDPLGWGWNLFGFKFEWDPIKPELLAFIQAPLIFTGLALALNTTYNIARKMFGDHSKAFRATLIMSILHILAAFVLIWIIAG